MNNKLSPPLQKRLSYASLIVIAGLLGYFIIVLHIAWLNNGGTGSELPYNLVAWAFISAICAVFWLVRPSAIKLTITPLSSSLFIGAALMSLPLLWSPSPMTLYHALPRIGGLWAGMIFFLTIRQVTFTDKYKLILFYALILAGVTEALIVLFEIYAPTAWLPLIWQKLTLKYGRYGVGVFQQVNVTASFLAVSLTACLFTFCATSTSFANTRLESIRRISLAAMIVLLSAVLTLLCSRIGWLAGICSVGITWLIVNFSQFKNESRHQILVLLLPFAGGMLGYHFMHNTIGQALAAHSGSNHQRILTLYQTLLFASKHPLLGYGAGTYEGYYQAFMARLLDGNLSKELMDHPHNEVLYQYSEGGIVALAGVLIWCVLYIRLWFKTRSFIQKAALLTILPFILHTQVEYPFYYSAPHWIIFLVFLRLADDEKTTSSTVMKTNIKRLAIQALLFAVTLYGSIISIQANHNSEIMMKLESNEIADANAITHLHISWLQRFRYQKDRNLIRLLEFQQTHDPAHLLLFTEENEKIIAVTPDPELYSNQIAILNYLHDYKAANEWLLRARYTLPWESQFRPIRSVKNQSISRD